MAPAGKPPRGGELVPLPLPLPPIDFGEAEESALPISMPGIAPSPRGDAGAELVKPPGGFGDAPDVSAPGDEIGGISGFGEAGTPAGIPGGDFEEPVPN